MKNYINEKNNENISLRELKTLLWNKEWNTYFDNINELGEILNNFRSVSDLPDNITKQDLMSVNHSLSLINDKIRSEIKKMKTLKR